MTNDLTLLGRTDKLINSAVFLQNHRKNIYATYLFPVNLSVIDINIIANVKHYYYVNSLKPPILMRLLC